MIEAMLKEVLHVAILWAVALALCVVALPVVSPRRRR